MHLCGGDIVHLIWARGAAVDTEDAVTVVRTIDRINADRVRPLLVDMRECGTLTPGARKVFSEPHSTSRVALLGESPVDRVIANFFIGVRQPPRPTRYFTSEATGTAWLQGSVGAID